MGGSESAEAAGPRPRAPARHPASAIASAHSLKELGIKTITNTSELRAEGYSTLRAFPVYVPRPELGQCVVTYKSVGGVQGNVVHYVLQVSKPLAQDGGEMPLAALYYRVPMQVRDRTTGKHHVLATPLPQAIVKFRPPSPSADTERERIGYVGVVTRDGVHFEVSWPVLMLALTLSRTDAELEERISFMKHPMLATIEDIANLQRACEVLRQQEPDTSAYLSTHESDATAWGDAVRTYLNSRPVAIATPTLAAPLPSGPSLSSARAPASIADGLAAARAR